MAVVVLVVDEPDLASEMASELGAAGLDVQIGGAVDAAEAIRPPRRICIADRGCARDRGIELLRDARATACRTPFIFVDPSLVATEPPPWEGDWVQTIDPYDKAELVAVAQSWARRLACDTEHLLRAPSLEFGGVVLDCGRIDLYVAGRPIRLSPTQFRVLHHLATNSERYVSGDELTQAVWGRRERPRDKHVMAIVRVIRKKLRLVAADLDLFDVRKDVGYRFVPHGAGVPTAEYRVRGTAHPVRPPISGKQDQAAQQAFSSPSTGAQQDDPAVASAASSSSATSARTV